MEQPQSIEVIEKTLLRLTWPDGAVSELTSDALRRACPCAGCLATKPGRIRLTVSPVTIDDAKLVGSYGISFRFGPDAHATGIYTFDQLRSLSSGDGT